MGVLTQWCAHYRQPSSSAHRLDFAIQLCGLHYPRRLLRPGEVICHAPLAFVGEQLGTAQEVLTDYAARGPTRYEQLDTLCGVFGFQPSSRPVRTELQAWRLPPALTTTNGAALARLLLNELRRRRIIVPGITPVERMVGKALPDAERHVGDLLTRNLTGTQRDQLDALLDRHDRRYRRSVSLSCDAPGSGCASIKSDGQHCRE